MSLVHSESRHFIQIQRIPWPSLLDVNFALCTDCRELSSSFFCWNIPFCDFVIPSQSMGRGRGLSRRFGHW